MTDFEVPSVAAVERGVTRPEIRPLNRAILDAEALIREALEINERVGMCIVT